MWWLNFALKWQDVSLRLPALTGNAAGPVFSSMRHFFRTEPFQQWAMARRREVESWVRYKESAKRYILDGTGDERYYRHKEKEDSLRHVMTRRRNPERLQTFMRDDFRPVIVSVPRLPAADAVGLAGRVQAGLPRLGRLLHGS
jgi:hypothetical protein